MNTTNTPTSKLEAVRAKVIEGEKHSQFRHGLADTPIYKKWEGMKRRCLNPNDNSYRSHGAKGITVCDEWMDFRNFYRDMAPSFKVGLSLDRIDGTKGYSKDNCRWATLLEQARNKKNVRIFDYKGNKMTFGELAELSGVKHRTLYNRIVRYGWSVEKAVETPSDLGNKYKLNKALPYGKIERN